MALLSGPPPPAAAVAIRGSGHPRLTGWSNLERVDAGRFSHRRHRLKSGEIHDVAHELGVLTTDQQAHRVIGRIRFDGVEQQGAGKVRHGLSGTIREMTLLDGEPHFDCPKLGHAIKVQCWLFYTDSKAWP